MGQPARAAAEEDAAALQELSCIQSIDFVGLERTRLFVLHGELQSSGVEVGRAASLEQIAEGVQKLRNLGVFREVLWDAIEVSGESRPAEDAGAECAQLQGVRLAIQVDEKWTLLPIFSFTQGGGTHRLILGAYDVNFMGSYINLGAQYERLGDTNSFFTWVSPQRLLGRDLIPALSLGSRNRVYQIYAPNGEVNGGFWLQRFSVEGSLVKKWREWFRTGVGLRFEDDDFSLDLLSEAAREAQQARGLPDPSHAVLMWVSATLGQLDSNRYLVDGTTLSASVTHANAQFGSSDSYRDLLLELNFFRTLPLHSTLGVRLASGFASTEMLHRRFYLGGLDALRGFASDRFSGNNYWLGNLEFRIPSVDSRWFLLQHIFFVDAAGVGENVSDIAALSGASAGLGVRIIVPKIQDFVIRVDYAFPIYDAVASPLGFGGGQFF